MTMPRLFLTALLVCLLGVWGTIAGPGWSPQPYRSTIIPETDDTTIGGVVDVGEPGDYEYTETVHDIDIGTQVAKVTLRMPKVDRPVPAVIFVHGTGTHSHMSFSPHARALASAGIATLVGDKPLDRYSLTERDYFALADAYSIYWAWLANQDGIDPGRLGIYGESEGAFIAPIVATERHAPFVILASSPVLPIRQQGALAADTYLRNIGVPDEFLRAIPRLLGGDLPFDYFDFDVSTYQKQLEMPILVLYGTGDYSMPVIQGAEQIMADASEAGNHAVTVRYYDGADHGLKIDSPDGPVLDPDVMRDVARWINGLPATAMAAPKIAGAQPIQHFQAEAPGVPRWYGSGDAMLAIVAASLVLTGGAMIILVLSQVRLRGRPILNLTGLAGPGSVALMTGIAAWLCFVGYVAVVSRLALAQELHGLIVRGGWLTCQVLAVVAAGMLVRYWYAWWTGPSRTFATKVSASVVGLACGALLVGLAYWNLYPSII